MDTFCFSAALQALKNGACVKRQGWSSDKCVELVKGNYAVNISTTNKLNYIDENLFGLGDYGTVVRAPHFRLEKQGVNTEGWTPTQEDLLAEDWYLDQD
jgi:hypothetical protein